MPEPRSLILDTTAAPASIYSPGPVRISGVGSAATASKAAATAVNSTVAAAAPTKAEFDALRADFVALKNALVTAGLQLP